MLDDVLAAIYAALATFLNAIFIHGHVNFLVSITNLPNG